MFSTLFHSRLAHILENFGSRLGYSPFRSDGRLRCNSACGLHNSRAEGQSMTFVMGGRRMITALLAKIVVSAIQTFEPQAFDFHSTSITRCGMYEIVWFWNIEHRM
jgi:hypothetical protein